MLDDQLPNRTRRKLIFLFPLSLFAGVFGSIGIAAFRFLRPRITTQVDNDWIDVASLSDLQGEAPVLQKIETDRISGWAISKEGHQVYVLPGKRQVFSAVCPHEGCEVMWEKDMNRFSCPCHESYFAMDGARMAGPARRGLDQLPTRIQEGKLQVQYQSYENNSAERNSRT